MTPILSSAGSRIRSLFAWMRKHKWISAIIILVLLIVGYSAFAATRPAQTDYVTALAEMKDVEQTVEAVGTVTSERDLGLQFQMSGIIDRVYVQEGDNVRAGQRLATLRAGTRAADISSAQAQVQSAEADLRALQEGTRPEDIAIIEAQVANKRASLEAARATLSNAQSALENSEQKLEALKREADINLSGYVTTAQSTISQQGAVTLSSLGVVDGVFSDSIVSDALLRSNSTARDLFYQQANRARSAIQSAQNLPLGDYQSALLALRQTRDGISTAANAVQFAYDAIANLQTTSYFTDSVREDRKSTLATERGKVQAALSAIDTAVKNLQDASASLDTRIATEESAVTTAQGTVDRAKADIQTYETSLKIDEAQLALKRAGARQTDIDAAAGRLRSARASLARAVASYNETVLTAPIDGVITKVDIKAGEYSPAGPSISMLGNSPYRIEMFVSEIDIPKIALSQSGSIELDAFTGVDYAVRVSEIDRAPTQQEGVNKYRVTLDFVYPHDEIKIGMKGDVDIITGERENVVAVPARAVIEDDEGDDIVRVLEEDGTIREQKVNVGLEGDSDAEIVSGLQGGETVIVLLRK